MSKSAEGDNKIVEPVDLLPYLSKPRTVLFLSELAGKDQRSIRNWLGDLQDLGYNIHCIGERWRLDPFVVPSDLVIDHQTRETKLKIGIVGDTHLCSKLQQLTYLEDFYTRCQDAGVKRIYHAGDMLAGVGVYRGQAKEIFCHTEDDQIDYVIDRYPKRAGIDTYGIGGNHCLVFVKYGGADPWNRISLERSDIKYLGPYSATIKLAPNCSLYMLHPDGGPAYATSYKIQKLIESFEGGNKPNIAVMGHYHKQLYIVERNVHGIMPGCFEGQTTHLRRKAIQPRIAGTILDIRFDDNGAIQSLVIEVISYLKIKEHDY